MYAGVFIFSVSMDISILYMCRCLCQGCWLDLAARADSSSSSNTLVPWGAPGPFRLLQLWSALHEGEENCAIPSPGRERERVLAQSWECCSHLSQLPLCNSQFSINSELFVSRTVCCAGVFLLLHQVPAIVHVHSTTAMWHSDAVTIHAVGICIPAVQTLFTDPLCHMIYNQPVRSSNVYRSMNQLKSRDWSHACMIMTLHSTLMYMCTHACIVTVKILYRSAHTCMHICHTPINFIATIYSNLVIYCAINIKSNLTPDPSMLEPTGLSRSDSKQSDGGTIAPWKSSHMHAHLGHFLHRHFCHIPSGPGCNRGSNCHRTDGAEKEEQVWGPWLDPSLCPSRGGDIRAFGTEALDVFDHRDRGRQIHTATQEVRAQAFLLQQVFIALQRGNAASVLGPWALLVPNACRLDF